MLSASKQGGQFSPGGASAQGTAFSLAAHSTDQNRRERERRRVHDRAHAQLAPEELRSQDYAFRLSVLRRGLRTAGFSQRQQTDLDRRRPQVSDFTRPSLPEGRSYV